MADLGNNDDDDEERPGDLRIPMLPWCPDPIRYKSRACCRRYRGSLSRPRCRRSPEPVGSADNRQEVEAKQGFLRTTTRAIAARAGVDAALVHDFFQTKEKLFSAAVDLPVTPEQLRQLLEEVALGGERKGGGERVVRFMLENVFASRGHAVAALIRAAVADPGCVPALRSLIEKTVVAGAASAIEGPDARLRAEAPTVALKVGPQMRPLASALASEARFLANPKCSACNRLPTWQDSRMGADYVAVNLANWNSRVPLHERGYGLEAYRADPTYLSNVVRFDRPFLGDISALIGVHLQCHIGTDTLSLARLGAQMTGLDFSAPALAVARQLAADCRMPIDYVESELYGAVDALGSARFDFVYTGVGALCWLPSIRLWAKTVSALLRPGGRLIMREGHPMLWSLCNPRNDGLVVVDYPYFETPGGAAFVDTKTYVEHDGELASPTSIEFNHGLAEIITALMDAGLVLAALSEHQSVPWDFLPGATVVDDRGEHRLRDRPERLAASYTLVATKPTGG